MGESGSAYAKEGAAMFCMRCGATNPDDGRFCLSCGASLQGQAMPRGVAPAYSEAMRTDGKAIASLLCGFLFFIFPAAVAAIILGHLSLSATNRSLGRLKGRGMAITGLVLGYGGILFIPFILIIAAIAIPNLFRARIEANEVSAAASLRTIESAALMYKSEYSNEYPPSLAAMDGFETGAASCDHAHLIHGMLAGGQRYGYVFTYTPVPDLAVQNRTISAAAVAKGCTVAGTTGFAINAEPRTRGTTGMRGFYVDQTGIIRVERNGPANSGSPMLGDAQSF